MITGEIVMEIYYCEKCEGKPYTKNISGGITCPVCNSILKYDDVSEDSLSGREQLNTGDKKSINILKQSIFNIIRESPENSGCFQINNNEEFFLYLDFKKSNHSDFTCRFIIGNAPDINSVITKTPFISSMIEFQQSIEIESLENQRVCIEAYALSNGWHRDTDSYYAFKKNTSGMELKNKVTDDFKPDNSNKIPISELCNSYYIEYKYPSFSEISIKNPFKRSHTKLFTEFRNVYALRNNEFMDRIFFRSKNGDIIIQLNSIAGAFAILYDDPYTNLIRYDRIIKKINNE